MGNGASVPPAIPRSAQGHALVTADVGPASWFPAEQADRVTTPSMMPMSPPPASVGSPVDMGRLLLEEEEGKQAPQLADRFQVLAEMRDDGIIDVSVKVRHPAEGLRIQGGTAVAAFGDVELPSPSPVHGGMASSDPFAIERASSPDCGEGDRRGSTPSSVPSTASKTTMPRPGTALRRAKQSNAKHVLGRTSMRASRRRLDTAGGSSEGGGVDRLVLDPTVDTTAEPEAIVNAKKLAEEYRKVAMLSNEFASLRTDMEARIADAERKQDSVLDELDRANQEAKEAEDRQVDTAMKQATLAVTKEFRDKIRASLRSQSKVKSKARAKREGSVQEATVAKEMEKAKPDIDRRIEDSCAHISLMHRVERSKRMAGMQAQRYKALEAFAADCWNAQTAFDEDVADLCYPEEERALVRSLEVLTEELEEVAREELRLPPGAPVEVDMDMGMVADLIQAVFVERHESESAQLRDRQAKDRSRQLASLSDLLAEERDEALEMTTNRAKVMKLDPDALVEQLAAVQRDLDLDGSRRRQQLLDVLETRYARHALDLRRRQLDELHDMFVGFAQECHTRIQNLRRSIAEVDMMRETQARLEAQRVEEVNLLDESVAHLRDQLAEKMQSSMDAIHKEFDSYIAEVDADDSDDEEHRHHVARPTTALLKRHKEDTNKLKSKQRQIKLEQKKALKARLEARKRKKLQERQTQIEAMTRDQESDAVRAYTATRQAAPWSLATRTVGTLGRALSKFSILGAKSRAAVAARRAAESPFGTLVEGESDVDSPKESVGEGRPLAGSPVST